MTVQGATNSQKSFEDRFAGDYTINGVNRTINALEIPTFTLKSSDLLRTDFSTAADVFKFYGKTDYYYSQCLRSQLTRVNQLETDITTIKQGHTKTNQWFCGVGTVISVVSIPVLIPCVCASAPFALPVVFTVGGVLLSLLLVASVANHIGNWEVSETEKKFRFENESFEKECNRVKSFLTTQLPQAYIALELYGDSLLNDLDKKIKDLRQVKLDYSEMDQRAKQIYQYQTLREELAQMIEFFQQFKTSTQEAIPTAPANKSEDETIANAYPLLNTEEDAS